ncbi:MAG: hypothetical protein IPO95_04745 [Rhodanobacteraceae bacterium]|nr:hypothetical protein [Rhodanobacteraceae bacterium]
MDYLRADMQALLDETGEGIRRVQGIVQNLRDFSRIGESEWGWTDLLQGLDSTLNIVNNEIKYKADIVKRYGDVPLVECVASQINQVFTNILVNAAQAIEGRGVVTISAGGDDKGWVWVEFTDSGHGIPKDKLTKIFEPFYTTKPIGKGTGLGLSVSYGIVERHGGRIEVESEPGRGSTFRVWLPVQRSDRRPTTAA